MSSDVVIVGASVGGVRVAQSLRADGFTGSIKVIDAEDHMPYDKPPLSKGFLSGSQGVDRISLISEKAIAEANIEFLLGTAATKLDVAESRIVLGDKGTLHFDQLVIATGVRARPSPWEATDGVHLLRSLDDALSLRADFESANSVVIVGAGFIGAEVAATARHFGLTTSLVDPLPIPMARVMGDEVGIRFIELHHRNQVQTYFGMGVESITGSKGNLKVELSDGTLLSSDVVVVGIGAVPNDAWLDSSGLLIDNGVVCDEYCRVVGHSNIYAIGDVARWHHPRHGKLVRVEHWTNAVEQAACVSHNITNPDELHQYAPVEYVWSDQYDWKIQLAGITAEADGQVILEDPNNPNRFAAIYNDSAGKYCGVVTVNWPRALIECRKLLSGDYEISVPVQRVEALLAASPSR